jgi:hypothetical protein
MAFKPSPGTVSRLATGTLSVPHKPPKLYLSSRRDCCKESCGWSGKGSVTAPIKSCDRSNNPLADYNVQSGCNNGGAFACSSHVSAIIIYFRSQSQLLNMNVQSPFAVNDSLAYGFAAVNIQGSTESSWCCQCYQLTYVSRHNPTPHDLMNVTSLRFTSGPVAGKKMIVQATNTGGDLGNVRFYFRTPFVVRPP